jgi:hypothetical protein
MSKQANPEARSRAELVVVQNWAAEFEAGGPARSSESTRRPGWPYHD